ncbi:hypothetical protein PRIPAC_93468 [Pristionchus pacificus]|uniref:Zinc finger protein n=1 Tax=Pristionchus pacificus TaxID=54126 RepID=A0A2A6BBP5_PRIPA|nr:hypothetical protein PRIPAC_93468 [Pristionchus pacificus]|eukprot:PDM63305.1 zinc finger protein [Pristionchus pacificus]
MEPATAPAAEQAAPIATAAAPPEAAAHAAAAAKPPSAPPRFASLAQRRALFNLKPVAVVTPLRASSTTAAAAAAARRPAARRSDVIVPSSRMTGMAAAGSAAAAAAARAAVKRPELVEPHHGLDARRRGGPAVAAAAAADAAVEMYGSYGMGLVTHGFRAHGVRKTPQERGKLMAIETNDQKSYYRVPASGDEGEKCPLCAERFVGPSSLSKHLLKDHKDERTYHFKCDECPRAYRSYDGMQKHQRIDHKRGQIASGLTGDWEASGPKQVCPLCAAPFRTEHRLSMHLLSLHRDTPVRHFRCDDCGAGFYTLEVLRKHKKKHQMRVNLPFPCDACCMRFSTWNGAITHQVQIHGKISNSVRSLKPEREKKFACPVCDELFDSVRSLSAHIIAAPGHEHLKHFECDICKDRFRSFVTMKCHRRLTHFRRRDAGFRFDCDVCERRFRKWEGLRAHQKMKHGEVTAATQARAQDRDYGQQCPLCKMYYQGAHSLSEHIVTAHADYEGKLFDCDECDKSYRHFAHLRAHKHTVWGKHKMPMKFKRRSTVPGGRRPRKHLVALSDQPAEAQSAAAGGDREDKDEAPAQSIGDEGQPVGQLEEGELDSEDESHSYIEDAMMSDIESEDEEGEEMEEGECTSDEDEPTTSAAKL